MELPAYPNDWSDVFYILPVLAWWRREPLALPWRGHQKPGALATTYELVGLTSLPAKANAKSINAAGQVTFTTLNPRGGYRIFFYNGAIVQDLGEEHGRQIDTITVDEPRKALGYVLTASNEAQIFSWTARQGRVNLTFGSAFETVITGRPGRAENNSHPIIPSVPYFP